MYVDKYKLLPNRFDANSAASQLHCKGRDCFINICIHIYMYISLYIHIYIYKLMYFRLLPN
jgi:hypothetical protein